MNSTQEVNIKIESKFGKFIEVPYYVCNGRTAVVVETTDPKINNEKNIGMQFWSDDEINLGSQKTPYGGVSNMLLTVSEFNSLN